MARPEQLLDAIVRSFEQSHDMPDDLSYLTQTPDTTGSDAGIKLPVCALEIISDIRLNAFNTDFVDFLTDNDGNHIGRIYESEYELDLQVDVWVTEGSSHDADELGSNMRRVLYRHDTAGPGEPLQNADGGPIEDVWKFQIGDGERADDLAMNPSLRRWRQEVALWSKERFKTTEDYIVTVDYPQDGEFLDGVDTDIATN